ncbi:hypothetical protein HGI47_17715 [Novosphingobium sp. ERN07]|uniref:hypothetical protein n=1 Tax=Novosphingobium sp. ERN07 TaxID=2726187 RepID=UPI001456EA97|nr:hypothetical protein [Novosphingobium sp. ERN07]NLR72715.1 hypothetical protein [Novosphingobium sp. ERN07]
MRMIMSGSARTLALAALAFAAQPAQADTIAVVVRVHVPPTCAADANGSITCNDPRLRASQAGLPTITTITSGGTNGPVITRSFAP